MVRTNQIDTLYKRVRYAVSRPLTP